MIPIDSFLLTISALFSRGKSLVLTNNELRVMLADGRNLSIAGLSSGEKHLIKILLSTMTAGPNSVLIDEPELSMHIDWQRVFVKTILSLNPDSQLILASHSPEVMADIDDSQIFRL
jgi:predicted ATP-dependent endonuclease of OLD family